MNTFTLVKNSMLTFLLQQMGGKIHQLSSIVCYVEFDIIFTKIKYVYHIDKNNKYLLQKIHPYNVFINEFENEEDVIKSIKTDIEKLKNATNSNKFNKFIGTSKEFESITKCFENLFLNYNISKYDLKEINNYILELKNKLSEISSNSNLICHDDKDTTSI